MRETRSDRTGRRRAGSARAVRRLLLGCMLAAAAIAGPMAGTALAKSGSVPIPAPSDASVVFTISLAGTSYSYTWADVSGTGALGASVTQSYLLDTPEQDPQDWTGIWLRNVLADVEVRSGVTLSDDWKLKIKTVDDYACSLWVGDVRETANNYLLAMDPVQGCNTEDPAEATVWYEYSYVRVCTNGDYGNTAFPARLVKADDSMTVLDADGKEIPAPATAHPPLGVVVTGDSVDAPAAMKTYSGDAFWITEGELAQLKSSKGGLGGFSGLWTTAKYSYCEDHGTPAYGYATGAGISLKGLLADAGLTAGQISALGSVTTTATDGFAITLDLQQPRFAFHTVGAVTGDAVDPMLALYRDDVDTWDELPSVATTAVEASHPTLMYGQITTAESNECGYVSGANQITLASTSDAFAVDAPDEYVASDRQKTPYTLAGLIAEGNEQRTYMVGGSACTCDGLDLGTILGESLGKICPQDRVLVTTSGGTADPGIRVADATDGGYLISYYSRNGGGTAVANGTQCMLYGDGLAIGDVLSVRIEHVDATSSLRLTSPTVSQAKASIARGSKLALRATTTWAAGATAADPVTWTSSNAAVATVGTSGTVTGKAVGTAVVTATSDSCTASITVKVVRRPINATKVTLPKTKRVKRGAGLALIAKLSPYSSTCTVTWKSSASRIAKVDRTGRVTGVRKGRATITVRTSNGKRAKCVVTVK